MLTRNQKRGLIFAAGAVVVVLVAAWIMSVIPAKTAYALEQTVEAFKSVRFVHLVDYLEDGTLRDERWIELGPDGNQVRYRQDTPANDFFVVEDYETVYVYHKDKNTVVVQPKEQNYVFISNFAEFFRDLAGKGSITIEENVGYKGRPAHRVRWLRLNQDYYIDPESKLPIAGAGYEFSYEEPPEGTFELVMPEGVAVVDKRPGAPPAEEPDWMKQDKIANTDFKNALHEFASEDYVKAAELFASVVKVQPGRNWAWFWLGRCWCELGEYDQAIDAYTEVIDIFSKFGSGPNYCHLARGLAYRKKGMEEEAKKDFGKCLGVMVDSLRHIEGAGMFDYADDVRVRSGRRPSKEQSLTNMINRLRLVSGQNFGYNPNASAEEIERVIAAWEDWWREHAQDYGAGAEQ